MAGVGVVDGVAAVNGMGVVEGMGGGGIITTGITGIFGSCQENKKR